MMKAKRSIETWAKEVVRCELLLQEKLLLEKNPETQKEIDQLEWKIDSIMKLYSTDATLLFTMFAEVEKAHMETLKK